MPNHRFIGGGGGDGGDGGGGRKKLLETKNFFTVFYLQCPGTQSIGEAWKGSYIQLLNPDSRQGLGLGDMGQQWESFAKNLSFTSNN